MTLLLGLVNERHAVLAADRRVTRDGRLVDDEFNKVCVLFCEDARFAIAFTGLAALGSFVTEEWLVEALSDIGKTTRNYQGMLTELVARADVAFGCLPERERRVVFLLVGYLHDQKEPVPVMYSLNNFGTVATFQINRLDTQEGIAIHVAGATAGFSERARHSLESVLASAASERDVVRAAVGAIQRTARDSRSRGLVGAQCNTAVVLSAPDTTIVSTYHSAKPTSFAYGADVVVAGGATTMGMRVGISGVLTGPIIRKKDPCWCGSGLQFKHCHLKTFGSVYVRLPEFTRPLFPFTATDFTKPRASGRLCRVACAFT